MTLPSDSFLATWTIFAVLAAIVWLVSEFRGPRWLRVILGIVTIIAVAITMCESRLAKSRYTQMFLHFSIKEANQLIKEGQADKVIREFDKYISVTSTNSNISPSAYELLGGLQEQRTNIIDQVSSAQQSVD